MINKARLARRAWVLSPVGKGLSEIWLIALICSTCFWLTAAALAESNPQNEGGESYSTPAGNHKAGKFEVEIDNFGKVTDFFYRGAQPKEEAYTQLATIGVKTIIDLRHDPKGYARTEAERAGLKYINLPMSDKDYPAAGVAERFLTLVNNQENWPVFVHCAGGRHRTGAMTAVFRMTMQGWDINRAYDEMKDYDFYTRWGHKAMKQYVYDYYRDLSSRRSEYLPALSR